MSTITVQIGCGLELIQLVLLPTECCIMLSITGDTIGRAGDSS